MNSQEFSKQIGKRIREVRKEKGHASYEKIAWEAGISRAQWGRYENGINLTVNSLKKVMDALGVTPAEFFSKGFEK